MASPSLLPNGTGVKRSSAHQHRSVARPRQMGEKSQEDREVATRVRAYLREAMYERELGQNEMARLLGLSGGYVSRFMLGDRQSVAGGMLLRISRALQINPTRLLGRNPDRRWFAGEEPPPEL